MSRARVILVFLDGVGLGEADPTLNPLATSDYASLRALAGDQAWTAEASPVLDARHVFRGLDATLGVDGLPQSGTGQASLFTGVNCAERAGRHWGPFPHTTSIPIIREASIFARLGAHRLSGQFANAFPAPFFRSIVARRRWTVTTRCCIEAGVPVRTEADLRAGRAIAADLTAARWRSELALDVPVLTPREAGNRLVELGDEADLTLFEYYLTDKAGHSRDRAQARGVLGDLDGFFGGILEALDLSRHLLVVTSDHGNLEDLSRRVHTRHPVPLIALGAGAERLSAATSITDVTPLVVDLLRGAGAL